MRYLYRNVITGAEFMSNCEITAPNFVKTELGAAAPIKEAAPEEKKAPSKKGTKKK